MSEDRIEIDLEGGWEAVSGAEAMALKAALAALDGQDEGGITILLTTDEVLTDLNGRFRSKPGPTNVLSFPAAENPERHLGDIALAYETCVREAEEQGKSIQHHLQHLVAHGVLHLLGYDHETEADALVMEELETRLLSSIGIDDPYAWRGDDHG